MIGQTLPMGVAVVVLGVILALALMCLGSPR